MVALVVVLLVVLGLCPCLLWPGLGGLLVHRLWLRWLPLVAEVAGGDADGGAMLVFVLLMPLAWVMQVLYPVLVCVGIVGDGEDGSAAGDGDGVGVVLARLLVVLVFPLVWMLAAVVPGAGRWVARVWSLVSVGLVLARVS